MCVRAPNVVRLRHNRSEFVVKYGPHSGSR